jgi:2-phosphoglycerate kinase
MTRLIKDLLAQRASETFVGRTDELEILLSVLHGGPRIVFLHGIAGVGKSTLLEEFTSQAQAQGAVVLSLDCQAIEPTERGFLHGLSTAIGAKTLAAKQAAVKAKVWCHEREWRIVRTAEAGLVPLDPEALDGVILGCKMKPEDRTRIVDALARRSPQIELLRADAAPREFKLVFGRA